ncbi:MAG: hypothetical protein KBA51_01470 [Kiritimatiellae bacterium]|nr:hypothetical protein [Kiritimatiellia bacterium]
MQKLLDGKEQLASSAASSYHPSMSPNDSSVNTVRPVICKFLAAVAVMAALAMAGLYVGIIRQAQSRQAVPDPVVPAGGTMDEITTIPNPHWTALRTGPGDSKSVEAEPQGAGPRFRLAGIFIDLGESGRAPYRKAILDDTETDTQYLAGENEHAGPALVIRIEPDRVVLEIDGRREELRKLNLDPGAPGADEESAAFGLMEEPDLSDEPPLEESPYGRRIREDRWVISHKGLTQYYAEMLDHPDRIVNLYKSFQPDRVNGIVRGHRLKIEGEREFLGAMGLRDDDVVLKVNSMNMTSQKRAEFFIGQFMQEKLGAVVLDIERDGQPLKYVYLVE